MKHIITITILVFLSITIPMTAQAQDGSVPYSVQGVLPENQVNNDVTYFDIEMAQGENQDLEVVIYNSSDEPITVNVDNNSAATNSNGIIIYDESEEKPHESMEYPLSEISSLSETDVEIAAGDQETVTLNVEAPEESFDGIILGGLYFTMEPDESEDESSLAIQNQYSYALAVQISEEGNDTEVKSDLELVDVEPGIVNHRTGLQTQFVNPAPTIIGGLEFEAPIYESGSDEPIYTRTDENFTVAPNSTFNYPIMFENQRLEPGTYVFSAEASNGNNEWSFEEEFEITEEVAEEANEEAVELEEDYSWLIYVVVGLIAVVVLLIIAVIYLFIKRKK